MKTSLITKSTLAMLLFGAVTFTACKKEASKSAEEEQATAAGWTSVQLGSTILRSSTACVAGAAVLIQWRAAAG